MAQAPVARVALFVGDGIYFGVYTLALVVLARFNYLFYSRTLKRKTVSSGAISKSRALAIDENWRGLSPELL